MATSRKTAIWIGALAAVFVTAVAIYTRNSGLFILAGLSAVSAAGLAARGTNPG